MSGSLRAASSNSAILRLASRIAPKGMTVEIFAGIDRLPFFNPDQDRELDDPTLPATVQRMRAALAASDALVISSPEYAHGVSGVLKNALDWLVGGAEMVDKRVGVFNTSPHSTHAHLSLLEILRTMSAHIVDEACLAIALPRGLTDDQLAADAAVVASVRAALDELR